MGAERADAQPDPTRAEQELRERLLHDPDVRRRLEEGLGRLRRGETDGPPLSRDELQSHLRDAE